MVGSKAALLLILYHLVKLLHCAEYHVKADSSSTCPTNATTCLTLSEYVQNTTYFTSESTFYLLQGQHHLKKTLILSGVTNITFRGDDTVITTISGSTTLTNSAGITLKDSTLLEILNVQFNGEALIFSRGIRVVNSTASFVNCSFTNWHSHRNGGAVYVYASKVTFSGTNSFTNNKAQYDGGAIYMHASNVAFTGTNSFTSNKANDTGGAIYMNDCNVTFSGINTFTHSRAHASDGGGIYVLSSTVNFSGNSTFLENYSGHRGAGLYSNNGHIMFNGTCTFRLNYAGSTGGGICITKQSTLKIGNGSLSSEKGHAEINFEDNTANQSGGALVAIWQSKVHCDGNINFVNNSAKNGSCGGVCIVQSNMSCSGNIRLKWNSATHVGGGIYVRGGTVNITGYCSFLENMAKDGGGMALEEYGWRSSTQVLLHYPVTVNFISNRAISNGGGIIFINSNSQFKIQNRINCFFSIHINESLALQNIQLNFKGNFAGRAGSVLYGGYLNCPITVNNVTNSNLSEILNISNTTNDTVSRFSSDPVKLCFCNVDLDTIINCNISNTRIIQASPGINFNISVVALGLGDIQVPSTIQAFIQNDYGPIKLPPKLTEEQCTNISYKIFTKDATNKTLVQYFDATSTNYVSLIMLKCPPGFTITNSQCRCLENNLIHDEVIKCVDTETLQIERLGDSWIDIVNDNTNSSNLSFMYHTKCPLNYCRTDNPIPLNFTNYSSNILCSSNRTGKLCGECVEGYSLTLNRFNCIECDNNPISLLLFFAFAGVALIAVLLVLHMTVAAGTINGLILYANIVNVNSFIFFPSHISSNKFTDFLSVFISWLNLDFGFETCFYNGLNAYTYAWLQYAFPLYLWFLIGAIIISSKYSAKLMKLIGSNPVAVLATVILMSYTKLLQAITQSLPYTIMEYSDGYTKKVWLSDANVTYFGFKHTFLVLTALCTLFFLLLPYTFLLLFGYLLQAFSTKRAFSWLNKIKPVLDVYYAPYRAKTRYWPGLMLLVRGCLYIITYMVSNTTFNLLFISSVLTAVALISWLRYRVYEKLYNDILEATFILNICLLSAVSYHVQAVDGNQKLVTYLSISIAFLQFLGIVNFHLYLRIKNIKLFELFRNGLTNPHPEEVQEEKPADVQAVSMTVMDLREPLLESQLQ